MASIKPYGDGEWRAQIARRGVRDSKVFKAKAAASVWAGTREAEIMAGVRGEVPNLTVLALLTRYKTEVSKHKKGRHWEEIRLDRMGRDRLAQVRLRQLDAPHVADWQHRRLQDVSSATVRRERNLLNNVFEIARKEWKWITKNPFEGVRRPKDGKPRDRLASLAEQEVLIREGSPDLSRAIVAALETAMRCGEIASKPTIKGNTAKLPDSKNGEGRIVPLSAKAKEAFEGGIDLTPGSISSLFAKLCRREKIKGLTFHDLKHTAMTRLSKILDPWELCKMTGNKDIKLVLRVYYKMDPEDVARKL